MLNFTTDKRGVILNAAFQIFISYGFKKTSMDDIARQAGMSRPALYQQFKNKTDIFRALSTSLMDESLERAKAALKGSGSLHDRLFGALDTSIMEMHRLCDSSPHGAELIGINQEIGRDIEHAWKLQMIDALAIGIDEAIESGKATGTSIKSHNVNSKAVARIIMHAMEGMRESYLSGESIDDYVRELIDFVAIPLET